jgi:tetratricopeptide (TPR) repeat protein
MNQEQLAERLAVDRSTVGRWERCESDPVPWVRPFLAHALEITLDELDRLLTSVVEGSGDGEPTTSSAGTADRAFFTDSARSALAFTAALTFPAETPDIETLHARVADAANAYLTDPLDGVVRKVHRLRAEAEQLLCTRRWLKHPADLLVILARALALLGNAAMDAGEHAAAHDHAEAAVHLASSAGHVGTVAWARGLQASNAFWAGDHALSATIAASALPAAREGTTGVFLACLLARASGRAGDQDAATSALERAQRARERATNDETGGVFAFTEAKQHLYAATAYLGASGNPARALVHAQTAVDQYSRAPRRSFGDEAGARIDIATARLRLGEPEGAIEALEPVLALPAELRVATIRTRLKRIHGELSADYGDLQAARDAAERIVAFRSGSPAL